jgi:hypothetical protein
MKLTIEHLKKLIRKELQKIDEVRGTKGMQDMTPQELADEIKDVKEKIEVAERENNQRKVKRLKQDLESLRKLKGKEA